MTFVPNQQDTINTDRCDYRADPVASIHIEETPCVVIRAVDATAVAAQAHWQPRTMHAWLT